MAVRHNIEGVVLSIHSKNSKRTYSEALEIIKKYIDTLAEKRIQSIKIPDYRENDSDYMFEETPVAKPDHKNSSQWVKMPSTTSEASISYAAYVLQNRLQCGYIEALQELKRIADEMHRDIEENTKTVKK